MVTEVKSSGLMIVPDATCPIEISSAISTGSKISIVYVIVFTASRVISYTVLKLVIANPIMIMLQVSEAISLTPLFPKEPDKFFKRPITIQIVRISMPTISALFIS